MTDLLYIAGYGRSGSTILDMMLGSHPDIFSTGELTYLLEDAGNPLRPCSCGSAYPECPIWGHWVRNLRPDTASVAEIRRIENRGNIASLLKGRDSGKSRAIYADYARTLVAHIRTRTGARIVLDSSKSARDAAGRPLALATYAGLDVKVLHLTRDPRASIRSYLDKGSNQAIEGEHKPKPLESWRPVLGWTYANRIAMQIGTVLGPERYLRLRFEDLMQDPEGQLAEIGSFVDLDLTRIAERVVAGEAFEAGHNVGGNRARLAPQRIRRVEAAPPRPLPLGHAIALRLLAGAQMRRLRY